MFNPLFKSADGERAVLDLYDAALSKWPVSYGTKTVVTSFGATYVISSGDAANPPLILLHGASSNATAWIADVAALSHDFYVHAVDVIGEPGKSAPTRLPLDGDAYAQWLAEVAGQLGAERALVMGLSQGGWLAVRYAVTYPEKVVKLVLLAPGGIVSTKPSFLLKAVILSLLGKRGVARLNQYVFGRKPIDAETRQYMDAIMNNFKSRMDKEYIFSDEELRRLTMPVLLIGGTEDVIRDNQRLKARLEALLPDFRARLLPTGHVLIDVSAHVVPFLRSS